MNKPFQREGSESNAQVGKDFELEVNKYFKKKGLNLKEDFIIPIGLHKKKNHRFDLGNESVLVECKSHKWTKTGNVPSAKIRNWNEAMYYFYLAPDNFKKKFVALHDFNQKPKRCLTLVEYYIENYQHMIPADLTIYEYSEDIKECVTYKWDESSQKHIRQE